ncbi:MAG: hypothetical protein E3J78_06550, partial [Candidatus Cloacimonadota bacterium]
MKISLRLKILLFTILLLFLVTFSIGYFLSNEVQKAIRNEIRLRGFAIARNLALNSEDPLVLGDDLYLQQLVIDAKKNEGVLYAIIVGIDSIVRAADSTVLWNTVYNPPSGTDFLSGDEPDTKSITYRGESILDIAFPVILGGKKKVGEIHLGLSKRSLEVAAKKIQYT